MKKILLTALLIQSAFTYAQNVVLHYEMQNLTSTTLPANNLVSTGTGTAFEFVTDGVTGLAGDSCVLFKAGKGLRSSASINTAGWTGIAISVWYKTTATYSGIITQGSYLGFGIKQNFYGKMLAFFDGTESGSISTTTSINDGHWHHLLAQNNGTTTFLYIDGVLEAQVAEYLNLPSSLHPSARVYLGSHQNNEATQKVYGRVDDFKIFDNVLTQAQVTALYQSTTPCSPSAFTDVQNVCSSSFTWSNGTTYTTNNNTATQVLTNAGGCDSTVTLNLTFNSPNSTTISLVSCTPTFTWNGSTYQSSGGYTWVGTNAAGCDSTVHLSLNIVGYTATIAGDGNGLTLTSQGSGEHGVQWIDCATDAEIPGATSSTFVPPYIGSFAAVVNDFGCLKRSNCITVTSLGVEENEMFKLTLYPNPTNDIINIQTDATVISSTIYDLAGSLVATFKGTEYSVSHLNAGVYFINVQTETGIAQQKFVKQ